MCDRLPRQIDGFDKCLFGASRIPHLVIATILYNIIVY